VGTQTARVRSLVVRIATNETDVLFPANLKLLKEARLHEAELDHADAPDGLLEEREGTLLYLLARRGAQRGDVLEIGSFMGRSTWYIALGVAAAGRGRVVAVDPHLEGTREAFHANLERTGIAGRVDVHDAYSHEVELAHPIGGLWIDGDHSYSGSRADFDRWFPRLAVGGWVAFHDTVNHWHGPTRLVRELLAGRDDLVGVGVIGTITYATKAAPSPLNRIRALGARAGFEVVTFLRGTSVGFGPRNVLPGER
jgi:predicted O-methyltransferase YrrM